MLKQHAENAALLETYCLLPLLAIYFHSSLAPAPIKYPTRSSPSSTLLHTLRGISLRLLLLCLCLAQYLSVTRPVCKYFSFHESVRVSWSCLPEHVASNLAWVSRENVCAVCDGINSV